MGQLEDFRLFVAIVEAGSITKAAELQNVAKSAVSRRLAQLESRYGRSLILREPGRWSLTQAGRELLRRVTPLLSDIDEVNADFTDSVAQIKGPLRMSAPREFGSAFLRPVLVNFMKEYPEIRLTVDFDDRVVDLMTESYDLALRISVSLNPDTEATKLGELKHALYASPKYLKEKGDPECVSELSTHQLLYFGDAQRTVWQFYPPRSKPVLHEFQPVMNSNSGAFLLDAVVNGLGICRLPDFLANEAVQRGELRQVLGNFPMRTAGIFLVYPQKVRQNRRTRLLAKVLQESCMRRFTA